MATNEILPFAADSTNILTQGEYDADAQRLAGHQPGIARSQLANKEAKQATAVAAGVGQFLADNQDEDVTDDLTPEALSSMMTDAIAGSIPFATVDVAGKTEYADVPETQAGDRDDAAVTPAGLAAMTATKTRAGMSRLARSTGSGAANDIVTGTNDDRAVTPLGLVRRVASTTMTGLVELATDEEAEAGTAEDLALTPANLAAVLAGFTATAASTTLPGGLIVKTGTAVGGANVATSFPTPFPTACFTVIAISNDRTDNLGLTAKSASGFTLDSNNTGHTNYWLAVGN